MKRVPIIERQRRISEGLRLAWKRRKEAAMTCATCEELTAWHQSISAARREWESACDAIDEIGLPSKSPDLWSKAVAARDSAFQRFMVICNEKP